MTASATIESREALAFPGDPDRAVFLRRVEALEGDADVDVLLDLRADFGRRPSRVERRDEGTWHLETGGLSARWSGAAEAEITHEGVLRVRMHVPAVLIASWSWKWARRCRQRRSTPQGAWLASEQRWLDAVPRFSEAAAPRDTRHAYAVLRGLTLPGGGQVAAATLGLPERARQGRNFDSRYVWLRDQAYAGIAAGAGDPQPLMDEAVAFTTKDVLEHGPNLAPAYRPDGRLPPREESLDLPGYPGGQVVVGNWVRGQFQLDTPGELLQLYATAGRHGHLSEDDHRALDVLVGVVERRWEQPDAGVRELDVLWWTHSRLARVAGLRSAAEQIRPVDAARLLTLADGILAATSRRCLSPKGAWQQAPDRPRVDTALLIPPTRGASPTTDPRNVATVQAVCEELVEDGYVYRYAVEGAPLGRVEGAFFDVRLRRVSGQVGSG